jgi:hypothetical protein
MNLLATLCIGEPALKEQANSMGGSSPAPHQKGRTGTSSRSLLPKNRSLLSS